MHISLVSKLCRYKIAEQVWEETIPFIYACMGYCSIHNVDPPSTLPSVPWPTSEHGFNIRSMLTWAWGSMCRWVWVFPSLYKLWASVWLVQTVAHLTAVSQTGYKWWSVSGSLVPPPAELCLQWNQRIRLIMRLLIQTFTICLALILCLAAPSWVLRVVHSRALFCYSAHLCESLLFLITNFFPYSANNCICSIILSHFEFLLMPVTILQWKWA